MNFLAFTHKLISKRMPYTYVGSKNLEYTLTHPAKIVILEVWKKEDFQRQDLSHSYLLNKDEVDKLKDIIYHTEKDY